MSSNNNVIQIEGLGKCYQIYDRPWDRLKQSIISRLQLLIGRVPNQYFREFWALRDVSFKVEKGETVGIIGRNGSGKSTLLQVICDTLAPTTGYVKTQGRIAALLELGAGFNPDFTGRENVYMNGIVLGLSHKEIEARFDDIAAFADIGEFIEQPVRQYSSGMYARLAFAVAINVDPDILVVDEALAVGDEPFQRKCFARMEEIKHKGGTILFVSHSTHAIVDFCDRAVLLYNGERLYTGKPKKAVSWYQKIMNADNEHTSEICEEIRCDDLSEDIYLYTNMSNGIVTLVTNSSNNDSVDNKELKSTQSDKNKIEEAFFDDNLVSKSKVSYESDGALITNPSILAANNSKVNCLINGERYKISYTVKFAKDCKNVRFRTLIKTLIGVELGGGTFPKIQQPGIDVRSGQSMRLFFEFHCHLGIGTYFLNCGVAEGSHSLHRIIDALVFRVDNNKNKFSFGIVDFLYTSKICEDDNGC